MYCDIVDGRAFFTIEFIRYFLFGFFCDCSVLKHRLILSVIIFDFKPASEGGGLAFFIPLLSGHVPALSLA